jgi:hypothetical protein
MKQEWFEMADVRGRKLDHNVWIPLRANDERSVGELGYLGYKSEAFATGSVAVPLKKKTEAEALGWMDLGLLHGHKGGFVGRRYVPADIFEDSRIGKALALVLSQRGSIDDPSVWHLHQDLVVTLHLKREGDTWVAIDEGYIVVARLTTGSDGNPCRIEIRAEHLKDYLCARGMALRVSSYRSRKVVVDDPNHVSWPDNPFRRLDGGDRWEGRVSEIHEGGAPFGSSMAVIHVGRTNVDFGRDVPEIGVSDEVASEKWTKTYKGRKLYQVWGELWRDEWIEPAKHSPRVRGDKLPPAVFFVTDASGTREGSATLQGGGRWLWFRPDVIMELTARRHGKLLWYTRDTGRVTGGPDPGVPFGVNKLGLVNVYAKDIAFLPEWQQQLWGGFNVGPEGGVSEELLAAQAQGIPADTQAPEEFLPKVIKRLDDVAVKRLGIRLFHEHEKLKSILLRTHRFRSVDEAGFFSLAKDLARLTADAIDAAALTKKLVTPPKEQDLKSLKALEAVLAQKINPTDARALLGPLHGIYNLRLADAHLPSSDLDAAYRLASVDQTSHFVLRGYQLIHSCVSCLYAIAGVLEQSSAEDTPKV